MKKLSLLFAFAILAVCLVGCKGKKAELIDYSTDLEGKVIGLVSTWVPDAIIDTLVTKVIGAKQKEINYYNRQADVATALTTGKIDGSPVTKVVADYYIKRNKDLKFVEANRLVICSIVMLVRNEDMQLKYELDSAITILQDSGIIKQLEDRWITNLPATEELKNKEIPTIEGAKTLYVGISGDETPLDYIGADGLPAGYNVALLSEISKILNVNFEFVTVETQAKMTALASKKIDLIFCQLNINDKVSAVSGNRFIGTKPYFVDEGMCFLVRK
jgi:polar amino acid transport system substrate-binding protein